MTMPMMPSRYRIRVVLEDQMLGRHITENRYEVGIDRDLAQRAFDDFNAQALNALTLPPWTRRDEQDEMNTEEVNQ